jgi:hypothetical protein
MIYSLALPLVDNLPQLLQWVIEGVPDGWPLQPVGPLTESARQREHHHGLETDAVQSPHHGSEAALTEVSDQILDAGLLRGPAQSLEAGRLDQDSGESIQLYLVADKGHRTDRN